MAPITTECLTTAELARSLDILEPTAYFQERITRAPPTPARQTKDIHQHRPRTAHGIDLRESSNHVGTGVTADSMELHSSYHFSGCTTSSSSLRGEPLVGEVKADVLGKRKEPTAF